MTARRTALVVVVDEEPVVEDFRRRFDPAVQRRIPADVTIVFPFAVPDAVDAAALRRLYAAAPPFGFEVARVERFPEHVWLAAEPRGASSTRSRARSTAFPNTRRTAASSRR
ncbi:MAG: 2'-5' RNA ligase family protein [Verrucomicrobiota bacterium]